MTLLVFVHFVFRKRQKKNEKNVAVEFIILIFIVNENIEEN